MCVRSSPTMRLKAARVIADESSRLYDAMHGIIPRLAPLVLDNFGLVEALNDLVERTRRSQQGVSIDTDFAVGDAPLPSELALTLYRAAQEGITNALQHGQAKVISLALHADAREVMLELADQGIGLPSEGWRKPGHYGLRWLAERVESLSGELRVEANMPRGVRLFVRVPMAPRTATP
jgi:two-component system, NarL family, sensor histidine kinase UhpB